VISSTAALNDCSLPCEGRVVPLSLRTNCNADARIVVGGRQLEVGQCFDVSAHNGSLPLQGSPESIP
jgi:hypothetical protein